MHKLLGFFGDIHYTHKLLMSKLIYILKFIKEVKITLFSPKQKDLLVFDSTSIEVLEKTFLSEFKYFVLEDRHYLITKIYMSPKMLFNIIKNIKYGIKKAYKISIIKCVNPKIIITFIHNSENFSFFAKLLSNKIYFLAIQNGNSYHKIREDEYRNLKRKYYIPHMLKLGYFDDESFDNSNWEIKKSDYVGSLRFDSFLLDVEKKKINLEKKYDLCILSDIGAWEINEDNINNGFRDLTKYVLRYAKEKNLKLAVALKRREAKSFNFPERARQYIQGFKIEQAWYEQNFSKEELIFLKKNFVYNNSLSSYMCSIQSEITIGGISTILREITAYNKKFLACNFTDNDAYNFPVNGICSLNHKCGYEEFSNRLDKIFKLSNSDFFKSLNLKKNYIIEFDEKNSTSAKIQNIIKEYL